MLKRSSYEEVREMEGKRKASSVLREYLSGKGILKNGKDLNIIKCTEGYFGKDDIVGWEIETLSPVKEAQYFVYRETDGVKRENWKVIDIYYGR
jgi:hypothetical protein